MQKYLIKYLKENSESELSKKYIDFLKVELDWHIYNSERHIANVCHRDRKITLKQKITDLYKYSNALLSSNSVKESDKLNVLTAVNFSNKNSFSDFGIKLYSPIWSALGKNNISGNYTSLKFHLKIQNLIRNEDFYLYLNKELHKELESYQSHFIEQYTKNDFRALFLSTDEYFYSKYFIDVFKKMDRPSFVFSHGLPGLYSRDVDHRADYLMVWSEKIKNNYINAGFDKSKVKVIGSSKFANLPKSKILRSSLTDVLVIPISSANWHQYGYDNIVLTDKSMIVLYLYQVQNVLKKLGIKKAKYRPHPSVNKEWIHAFLDHDFYICDQEDLQTSLDKSTLVIGSTSTVLFEALMNGVNYVVFEPKDENGINMAAFKTVPPFDGSEKKIVIANDETELEKVLKFNAVTDYNVIFEYIQDFDEDVLKELIK
ncbi:hypothetical protein [Flavobacterium fluviale]|uniref:CDP-Glycerol:Poly(Glycerophosphate) glycerophosphotransferase n=1 Tax=Flavobacterium fluviale TaxID=2249356 RepID=A0A344LN89_9FLAO|nr:hypothetical protein [Flavobacterium fluviale]AXB55381.1 hypothetical protein HYN86_01680 [Flavobacterium fluviale]